MSQITDLPININKLIDKVLELKEKTFLVPPVPKIDISKAVMTPRQIAKRILLISAGAVTATGNMIESGVGATNIVINTANSTGADINTEEFDNVLDSKNTVVASTAARMLGQIANEETAHLIVYGKFKRDANGKLIDNEILDPDCVLHKIAMPDTHPTMADVSRMVTKVTKVLKMLGIRQQDLLDDIMQASIAIPASIMSMASAAAILPPGAGLPVAFSAFQGLMATIMNLVSKIAYVIDGVEDLNYLPMIIQSDKLDAILVNVNAALIAINVILDTIDGLTKIMPSFPSPPGLGNEPAEAVKVTASADPGNVSITQDFTLVSTASNGSWEYNYQWTGPNGFSSTSAEVTVYGGMIQNGNYTFSVTASDKKDSSNKATAEVTVVVG